MLSAEVVEDFLKELNDEKKSLKKSEKKEIEITKKFNESIRKLSLLL
jgi:hypothetical protein